MQLVSRKRNKLLRMSDMLWSIVRYGRKQQPVVIDVYSTLNFYYALACGLLCRVLGIRYLCVLHGGNLPGRLERSPFLSKLLFSGAAQLIAPSVYLQRAFAQKAYEAVVIPNFLQLERYPFRLRSKLRPHLLWVRAFDEIYNPCLAIRILRKLIEDYPDASLCMVGPDKDGSLQRCRTLAEDLGVGDKVRFTGRLSKEAWIALSAEYDLFINTTNYDNTPVSVVEALALGFPIISTDAGGLPDLIEDGKTGLLVSPDDEEMFTKKITMLLQTSERAAALSRAARKKAEEFAWEQVGEMWREILYSNASGSSIKPGASSRKL